MLAARKLILVVIGIQTHGEAKLPHLFQPGRFGRFEVKNRIKYGACCVSNYNTRDGFITEREIARMKVIARTGCGIAWLLAGTVDSAPAGRKTRKVEPLSGSLSTSIQP